MSRALFVQLPAHQHRSSCQAPAPPSPHILSVKYFSRHLSYQAFALKGSSLLTHPTNFIKRNVKGRKGRRSLASENVPNLLMMLLKSMVSSATSLQNPLPWFFIRIKLHSAKQNKKYQPCVVVSDPRAAHPCWLLHG